MTALLFDTNSVFFRAHYALPEMTTSTGEPTSALYGTSVLLLKLLREMRPDGVAFARDLPAPTFRHAQYDAYKAGRPPVPDALRTQWRRLDALLAATGAPTHAAPGFEADDVLATLAMRLVAEGRDVVVVSGDRDMFQIVGPRARVLFLGARGKKPEMVDEAVVRARYGIAPASMPAWAALVGEAADNLPGVPGIGAKTATKLVTTYGTIGALVRDLAAVEPAKLRAALESARESVLRNEDLATLRRDVDLGDGPLVAPIGKDAFAAMRSVFEAVEFKSLAERLDGLAATIG